MGMISDNYAALKKDNYGVVVIKCRDKDHARQLCGQLGIVYNDLLYISMNDRGFASNSSYIGFSENNDHLNSDLVTGVSATPQVTNSYGEAAKDHSSELADLQKSLQLVTETNEELLDRLKSLETNHKKLKDNHDLYLDQCDNNHYRSQDNAAAVKAIRSQSNNNYEALGEYDARICEIIEMLDPILQKSDKPSLFTRARRAITLDRVAMTAGAGYVLYNFI